MADDRIVLNTGVFAQKQISGQIYGSASGCGALRVAQVEPPGLELSRAGARFAIGQSAAITGIAPVQTVPTTAAQWTFWNASTTKSMVFEMIGAYLVSGTAGTGTTVWCAHINLPANATTKAGITVTSASNNVQSSNARINSGVTVTSPAAPAWFFICRDDSANTVALNVMAFNEDLRGNLIVPPQRGLGLSVVAPAGTSPLYVPMGQWTEIALDLE